MHDKASEVCFPVPFHTYRCTGHAGRRHVVDIIVSQQDIVDCMWQLIVGKDDSGRYNVDGKVSLFFGPASCSVYTCYGHTAKWFVDAKCWLQQGAVDTALLIVPTKKRQLGDTKKEVHAWNSVSFFL